MDLVAEAKAEAEAEAKAEAEAEAEAEAVAIVGLEMNLLKMLEMGRGVGRPAQSLHLACESSPPAFRVPAVDVTH